MFTTNSLQQLPFYNDILGIAQKCVQTNRAAVLLGACRSGGTILGQWLVESLAEDGAKVGGLYYQLGWDGSYSTIFKSLLRRLTSELPHHLDRDAVANSFIESLRSVNCRLLYIDEADRATPETLRELFRIQDLAARANHPFGILLFGHRQPEDWVGHSELGGGKIRYKRVIPELLSTEITAILEEWCPSLENLRTRFDSNERQVRGAITLLEENGGSRVGVLEDYAVMLNAEFKKRQFSSQVIQEIIAHADSPTQRLAPRFRQLDLALEEAA